MAGLIDSFETGGFSVREQVAQQTAATASQGDLISVIALFMHESSNVRLGAIEVVAEANFRPGMGALKAVIRAGSGDERVFAMRALSRMATPADEDDLLPLATEWAKELDTFVQTHARAIIARFTGGAPTPEGATTTDGPGETSVGGGMSPTALTFGLTSQEQTKRREALVRTLKHHPSPAAALADAIGDAVGDGVLLDLITGLGTLPPELIASVAPGLLRSTNASACALLARTFARKLAAATDDVRQALSAPLEDARKRHMQNALTRAALDDAQLTLVPDTALPALLARADSLDASSSATLAAHLASVPPSSWVKHFASLLESLRRKPVRLAPLANGLAAGLPAARPAQKSELLRLLKVAMRAPDPEDLRKTHARGLATLLSLLAQVGDPLPIPVVNALEMSGESDDIHALIDLLRALGSEEAVEHLIPCLQDPDESVREHTKTALAQFPATQVVVELDEDGTANVVPNYRTESGAPLSLRDGQIVDDTGALYVLDAKGRPVTSKSTPFGGCVCCSRPRALERNIGVDGSYKRPQCPATGAAHLKGDGENVLEREHPLGGCGACESLRPLERHNDVVSCHACGAEHTRRTKLGRTAYFPRHQDKRQLERNERRRGQSEESSPPSQNGSRGGPASVSIDELKKQLPNAPTPSELQLVEPTIAHAMAANAFLLGRMSDTSWNGSGIVVAIDDNYVAILTNRHVVERATGYQPDELADMYALLISGEVIRVRCVWRAKPGIDLALLVGEISEPDRLAVTPIGDGACLVGTDLFAIGNPMGLSWSYTSGACSAFRETNLEDGRTVREVQTQAPMARGSSGGGLYHKNGHLVGIMASVRSDEGVGSSAHFAVAVSTIRETLEREDVQWRGVPLLTRIDALS